MGPSAPSCRLGAPRPSLVLGAQHRDALRSSSGPGCPIPTIAVPPHTHKAPPAQPLEERTQRKGKGAVGQLRLHGKQNPWSREGVRDASSQVSRPGQAFWSPTPPHPLALRWPCAHLEGRPGLQLCPHILHLYWLLFITFPDQNSRNPQTVLPSLHKTGRGQVGASHFPMGSGYRSQITDPELPVHIQL